MGALHFSKVLSLLGSSHEPTLGLLIQFTVVQRLTSLWGNARCVPGVGSAWDLLSTQDRATQGLGPQSTPTQAGPWFYEFNFRIRLL